MPNMIELVKKAAVDAVAASDPVAFLTGKVTSAQPLKISVEQRLTLGKEHLMLSGLVKDQKIETENGTITLKLALKAGETVTLLRMQGGQKFFVLDRMG